MYPNIPQQFPIHARFDTLDFMLRFHLPKEMVAAFREANGLRFRTFGVNKYARCRGWQQGITFQSPTRAALELASEISPSDLLPVGLHPCLDNIQPSQEAADELIDFYQKHAVQRNVRTMTVMCEDTSYAARGNGRTKLVMYSTKLDKVMDVLNWSNSYEQDEGNWCLSAALASVVKAAQDINRDPTEWHPAHQDALISLFFRYPHNWSIEAVASFIETREIGVTVANLLRHSRSTFWMCIISNCEMTIFRNFSIEEDAEHGDSDDDARSTQAKAL